jgi:hypothetical protein
VGGRVGIGVGDGLALAAGFAVAVGLGAISVWPAEGMITGPVVPTSLSCPPQAARPKSNRSTSNRPRISFFVTINSHTQIS